MINIIYTDEFYTIAEKPSGIPVHLSKITTDDKSLLCVLQDQLNKKLYPVHRLDRATSGVIVFAHSSESCGALGKQFQEKSVDKKYQAIVRGWLNDEGKIDHPLYKNPEIKSNKVKAITNYKCLKRFEIPISDGRFATSRFSLAEISPQTGRMHQIRRHFAHISHHLIGDTVYGKGLQNRIFRDNFQSNRLLLAAVSISFTHPYTENNITVHCPLADSFESVINKLEKNNID